MDGLWGLGALGGSFFIFLLVNWKCCRAWTPKYKTLRVLSKVAATEIEWKR
jgi:hypothetical protein